MRIAWNNRPSPTAVRPMAAAYLEVGRFAFQLGFFHTETSVLLRFHFSKEQWYLRLNNFYFGIGYIPNLVAERLK